MVSSLQHVSAELPEGAFRSGTSGRILTSALRTFAELGYSGSSIRIIAAGVGINSATLYSHFASKSQILSALVRIGAQELLSRVHHSLDGAISPWERLDAIISASVRGHATYPLLAIVTNTELRSLPDAEATETRKPIVEAALLLRQTLTDGIEAQDFDIANLEVTAHVLEGLAVGIPYWFDPAVHDSQELARQYVAIVRRIVAA